MRWRDHSLTIALGLGFIVTDALTLFCKPGTRVYDQWLMLAGSFGGSWLMVVFAIPFYERKSNPQVPPEECTTQPPQEKKHAVKN